jgi:hypothetical protein
MRVFASLAVLLVVASALVVASSEGAISRAEHAEVVQKTVIHERELGAKTPEVERSKAKMELDKAVNEAGAQEKAKAGAKASGAALTLQGPRGCHGGR